MTSFVRFLNNDFSLKGLEELTELNGKKFKDLDKTYQRTIKSSSLNSIILTKESQELKYEIFARLNQQKNLFFWLCAHLFVPLQPHWVKCPLT